MSRFVLFPVVLLSLVFLPACATLTTGTAQSILVDVLNVQGADCRGTDTKGRTYVWAKTPSSTTVHKGDGPITLTRSVFACMATFHLHCTPLPS